MFSYISNKMAKYHLKGENVFLLYCSQDAGTRTQQNCPLSVSGKRRQRKDLVVRKYTNGG